MKKRILLLDYQKTLVANLENRRQWWKARGDYRGWIAQETYRDWLVELVRPEYVILISARHERYGRPTLARIAEQCGGWLPNEAYWNPDDVPPAPSKARALERYVFPRHGDPEAVTYLALESNRVTRAMYSRRGITATAVPYAPPVWAALPWPTANDD